MGQLGLIRIFLGLTVLISSQTLLAQYSASCNDPAFTKVVDKYLKASVPQIDVDSLTKYLDEYVIVDARELAEYETSHIAGAHYVGYDDFDPSALDGVPRNQKVVVYCSIGYRSEKVGEKLKDQGYLRVFNLYGGIFEWTNRGNPVVGDHGSKTDTLHGYSKNWSRWASNPDLIKVW